MQTTLRSGIVLLFIKNKKIILVELTVQWEEGCQEALEMKALKYQSLVKECREKGWQIWPFPKEIGCRGFPAKSACRLFSALGARNRGEGEAERASCWFMEQVRGEEL